MKKIPISRRTIQIGFKGLNCRADGSVLDPAYSAYAFNCTFGDGVLQGKTGIDRAKGYYMSDKTARRPYPSFAAGEGIKAVFAYYKRTEGEYDDRIVAIKTDGTLWYIKVFLDDIWHQIKDVSLSGRVCAVNYNYDGDDVLLLSSENDSLVMINGRFAKVLADAPKFSSLAVHNERVYGSVNGDRNQVWFSDDFDPANWSVSTTEAGYINFSDECGDVLKVLSFLNYVYIFREHGIFRLTAYGDQTEFSLKKVFTYTGRIYERTITLCGDYIMFLSDEGIMYFDGYDVRRAAQELPEIREKYNASGAYHNNCYYLAANVPLGTFALDAGLTNNALIRYDVREKNASVTAPFDIAELSAVDVHHASDLMCVFRNDNKNVLGMISDSGEVLGTPTHKYCASPENVFGSDRLKTIRSIMLTTKYSVRISVMTDGEKTDFDLKASSYPQIINVEKSGYRIGFIVDCANKNLFVTPLLVKIDLSL